jgi:gas vesicle protein
MKNPFEKNDHKVLIAGVIIGSVVVGAAAYLFLTETGANVRRELTGHLNRVRDVVMGTDGNASDDEGRSQVAGPENV